MVFGLVQEAGGGGGHEHQQHDGGEEARPTQLLDALHGPPGSVVDLKGSELFAGSESEKLVRIRIRIKICI